MSDRMVNSTCTMSRSARRPREDTLTSSPSSSSMAERGGRERQSRRLQMRPSEGGGVKVQLLSRDWLKPFDAAHCILSRNRQQFRSAGVLKLNILNGPINY